MFPFRELLLLCTRQTYLPTLHIGIKRRQSLHLLSSPLLPLPLHHGACIPIRYTVFIDNTVILYCTPPIDAETQLRRNDQEQGRHSHSPPTYCTGTVDANGRTVEILVFSAGWAVGHSSHWIPCYVTGRRPYLLLPRSLPPNSNKNIDAVRIVQYNIIYPQHTTHTTASNMLCSNRPEGFVSLKSIPTNLRRERKHS